MMSAGSEIFDVRQVRAFRAEIAPSPFIEAQHRNKYSAIRQNAAKEMYERSRQVTENKRDRFFVERESRQLAENR
jgi:hypothetical protein